MWPIKMLPYMLAMIRLDILAVQLNICLLEQVRNSTLLVLPKLLRLFVL